MRILLLKPLLVGLVNHKSGDDVEVDEQRGKALVKKGHALRIKVTGPESPIHPDPEPDELVLRQAVAPPPKRKRRSVKAD